MESIPIPLLAAIIVVWRRLRKRERTKYIRLINTARNSKCAMSLIHEMRLYDEESHRNYFRMSRHLFDELLSMVDALIQHPPNHRFPINSQQRLALTLRILATGESYQSSGFSFRMAKSTVKIIFEETCLALCQVLRGKCLSFPSMDRWQQIESDFFNKWNFPNCCGAIDGKHVMIKCPSNSCSQYYNYKGTFSINFLACVDANYMFTVVDIGAFGRDSDGGVFASSKFGKSLSEGMANVPHSKCLPQTTSTLPHVFIGDDAFPLKTYLMKPFSKKHLTYRQRIFNYRLSRSRRIVENAFGILACRWGIYQKPISVQPSKVDLIIETTVLLHNYLLSKDLVTAPNARYVYPSLVDFENDFGVVTPGEWHGSSANGSGLTTLTSMAGNNYSRSAFEIRELFADYFVSDVGSVQWQDSVVRRGENPTI